MVVRWNVMYTKQNGETEVILPDQDREGADRFVQAVLKIDPNNSCWAQPYIAGDDIPKAVKRPQPRNLFVVKQVSKNMGMIWVTTSHDIDWMKSMFSEFCLVTGNSRAGYILMASETYDFNEVVEYVRAFSYGKATN
jgi:hypothetical protein